MALALVTLEAHKFDAANEFFNLALKVKREDAAGLFEAWGVGLILAEQYADAATIFQRAIDEHVLPEGNSVFHHYLAGALEMAGKTDEALAVSAGRDRNAGCTRRECTRGWRGCCTTPNATPTPSGISRFPYPLRFAIRIRRVADIVARRAVGAV